jgi:hypothetical protein
MDRFELLNQLDAAGYPKPQTADQSGTAKPMAAPTAEYFRFLEAIAKLNKGKYRPPNPETSGVIRG